MKKRTFRRFWPLELGKPALLGFGLSALIVRTAYLFTRPYSLRLLALSLVPLGWFFGCYLSWRKTTYTYDARRKEIVLRHGIVSAREKSIPLNFPPQVSFSQGLAGRIFNFGDAKISAFGGGVHFRGVENFRAFKATINSRGEGLPGDEPSFLAVVTIGVVGALLKLVQFMGAGLAWLVRSTATLLAGLAAWFLGQVRSAILAFVASRTETLSQPERPDEYFPGMHFSPEVVSFAGFLAFCTDFILSNGRRALALDYTLLDDRRQHYPRGISPAVAQIYFEILRRGRIVVPEPNGHYEWIVSRRILDINDIKLRISRQAFDRIAVFDLPLRLTQLMAQPEMITELTVPLLSDFGKSEETLGALLSR